VASLSIAAKRRTRRNVSGRTGFVAAGRGRIPIVGRPIVVVYGTRSIVVVRIVDNSVVIGVAPVPGEPEVKNSGMTQGITLIVVQEGHKERFSNGDIAFHGDDHVDGSAGDSLMQLHEFIHQNRIDRAWRGAEIKVDVFQIHVRTFGRGPDLKGSIILISAKQAESHQQSQSQK